MHIIVIIVVIIIKRSMNAQAIGQGVGHVVKKKEPLLGPLWLFALQSASAVGCEGLGRIHVCS